MEVSNSNQVVLPSMSLDETIEQIIGRFGCSQFMQAILVSVPAFFDAQQTFISIYADAVPKWHCNTFDTSCNPKSNICKLPRNSWSWDEPSHYSIISDWGLECASSFITSLPASSFYIGSLIGGFTLAILGDFCLGRKNLLYLSSLIMSVTALLSAFSTNIWMYSSLRFVSGLSRSSVITCTLILITERIGKRLRSQVGTTAFFSYALGLLSLPAVAYTNRGSSWRILFLYTSIPAIFYYIITYFFVYESPRWLFMQGRDKEAIAILKRIASIEDRILDSYLSNIHHRQEIPKVHPYKSMKDLFKRKWALKRILAAMVIGFGVGVVYFGMLLGMEKEKFIVCLLYNKWHMQHSLCHCRQSVRNSATSLARQAVALGSVFDPVSISIGRRNEFLSFGIFGLTILLCGFFVIVLPETRGKALCNTMDEQESKDSTMV
uniref:Major facilitator superfamily (MFS) profile domain-containing protein n=1 Tax=Quercus lobata TaxID=97700 RepID=A0A7N2MJR9_QUELO